MIKKAPGVPPGASTTKISIINLFIMKLSGAKLLQKSEMRKDIVIELSYKGFG